MTTDQVSDRDLVLSVIDDFFDKVDRLHQLDPATMTEEELWRYLETEHRVSETLSMLQRNMIKSLTRASPEELGFLTSSLKPCISAAKMPSDVSTKPWRRPEAGRVKPMLRQWRRFSPRSSTVNCPAASCTRTTTSSRS
ncbi:hypothetical protein KQR54_04395 [Mycobacterium gordonae]|uniref:hypothetical protein n=1 Tax=Mycobacterium gordonae TaxID=1778 RepID=UPI00210917D2|nr:hypothetical protein [Mycobacterium gordonae]MCQ4360392.1 hypothetical protein [Mycobacterium gordonae]